jgi:catechol 2,3-dioxygenase-like lactoylglutathione lyase family enzyme
MDAMKRLHVMIKVRDLDESLAFYRELFAAEPTVRRDDYAKWMLDDPRVNFSIGLTGGDDAGIEHLGIQAETAEELAELRGRIERAGGTVENEGETTCCYASSDKTWVVDAQGVAWEAFFTHGTAATYRGDGPATGRAAGCCQPAVEIAADALAVEGACCAPTCCTPEAAVAGAA